jgi:preprotein translocase subunit SecD
MHDHAEPGPRLRNRINALGVSEPLIQQQGDSRIVVELAGVQDPAEAKKLIGATATLQYRAGIGYPGDPRRRTRPHRQYSAGCQPLLHARTAAPVLVSKRSSSPATSWSMPRRHRYPNGTPNVSVR